MSVEGDRNKAGMFSEGEVLSATKLNIVGELAGYGKQFHSAGAQVVQGPFGTVTMDGMTFEPYTDDQFKVSVGKEGEDYWFTINPGYVTVRDNASPMTWDKNTGEVTSPYVNGDGKFTDDAQPFPLEIGYMGHDQLYYVDTCNAYGAKKNATKDNKLINNSFKPDSGNGRFIIVFLYRAMPGMAPPKIGVCYFSTFQMYFMNQSQAVDPSKVNVGPNVAAGQDPVGCPAIVTIYQKFEYKTIDSVTFKAVAGESLNEFASFEGYGLAVQILAIYDTKPNEEKFLEVNRGHTNLNSGPMVTSRLVPEPPPAGPKFIMNTGWHAYFYTTGGAGFTGLKFEGFGPKDTSKPPLFPW